jgi:ubiquinone/menaquinone biosynthesis C-methylase UbiE
MAGFINHDRIRHAKHVDVAHDLNGLPWPWADESFDYLLASSVFEHLNIDLVRTLDECWRILRPGGRLQVKVPHWQHDNAHADPTHRWAFSLRSFDVFFPKSKLGRELSFYTQRKWRALSGPRLNRAKSSMIATLQVIK